MKWYKASQSEGVSQPAPCARTKEGMQPYSMAVIRRSYWVGADIRQKTGYMQSCARMQSYKAKQVSRVSMPYLLPCGSLTLLLSHACGLISDLSSFSKSSDIHTSPSKIPSPVVAQLGSTFHTWSFAIFSSCSLSETSLGRMAGVN